MKKILNILTDSLPLFLIFVIGDAIFAFLYPHLDFFKFISIVVFILAKIGVFVVVLWSWFVDKDKEQKKF